MHFHLIERIGGWSRAATLLTIVIHFLHPLFCVVNYLNWVREQEPILGWPIITAYLAMLVVACVSYLAVTSVFYMWAWRFPEPEEVAKRRRIYGVVVNLFFSDIPMFVIETKIVWQVKFADGVQGFNYCLTCVSIAYSVVRVWTFFMVKIIKVRAPVSAAYPRFSLTRRYSGQQPRYENSYGADFLDDARTPDRRTGRAAASPVAREMSPYSSVPSVSRYYYDEDEPNFSPESRGGYSYGDEGGGEYGFGETPVNTRRRL